MVKPLAISKLIYKGKRGLSLSMMLVTLVLGAVAAVAVLI